jgi:mono/diheme cytochrome c family protein
VSVRRGVAVALALAGATAGARAADAERVEAGRKLYVASCQRCHGINLVTGSIGFDLRTFPPQDKERFVRSVTHGLRQMPAWGGTLTAEQIDLIWGYVGTVNGWKE